MTTVTTSQKIPTAGPAARRPAPALRPHVIGAVFRRDFLGYFNNPAGYVFLALFGLVCALAEFCLPAFFANNLANLGPLDDWMPYLLLFFIPAVTMSIWAEERRQGTDELLLTLPARDVEVVLGKYLAALGIYTVALLFLGVHVWILSLMGDPDMGVIAATFLGYWLMGAMLIAIGMVASLLSSNATVAFILGGLFAAVPVFADQFASTLSWPLSWLSGTRTAAVAGPAQRLIEDLSVSSQFRSFAAGVVTLPGVVYFLSWAAGMLYVNMVLLGRRQWAGGQASAGRWAHALTRTLAVAAALIALNVLVGQASSRWDTWATVLLLAGLALGIVLFVLRMTVFAHPGRDPMLALLRDLGLGLLAGLLLNVTFGRGALRVDASQEGLTKLSRESVDLLAKIPPDRPVFIQAYLSPRVPREYVQLRADLANKLREFAAKSDRIRLNLVEPERYSVAAREAEKRFGIEPRRVVTTEDGRQGTAEIYLGAAFTSGPEEVVIPFFEPGVPVEYELARSVRVVSRTKRKKVGILSTDVKLLGGFDMRTMGPGADWPIVAELKKQYEVSSVSPDGDYPADLDALIVAQPSSLTQRQIDTLTAQVRKGVPTLLLMDPLPIVDPSLSPSEPRANPGAMFGGAPPPEPKGDLLPLLDLLGIEWISDRIVWNNYNPTKLRDLPPEVVVIGRGADNEDAFNAKEPATSGLQKVAMLYAGALSPKETPDGLKFTPLLRTNDAGGTVSWSDLFPRGLRGMPNPRMDHFPSDKAYTVAARVQGVLKGKGDAKDKDKEKGEEAKPGEVKVIAIADLDLMSETFFGLLRQVKTEGLDFDDVTFVLNCIDTLAGDEDFVDLRSRRPKYRTLEVLERHTRRIEEKRLAEEKAADQAAKDELDKAKKNLDVKVKELSTRKDIDERTKDFMVENLLKAENRRLDNVVKVEIEDEKRRKNQESEAEAKEKIRAKQNEARLLAILLPPLLPLLLGVMVFGARLGRENRGASPNRLA